MKARLFLFLLALAGSGAAVAAQPRSLSVSVIRVIDGDTVVAMDSNQFEHRIRLAGIDAPERAQAFNDVSRRHLASLIQDKTVRIEWAKTDSYGRLVARILVDGEPDCAGQSCTSGLTDVNLEQIKAGLAWHYKAYEKEQNVGDRRSNATAEQVARLARLGLWKDTAPVPPWDWRRGEPAASVVRKSRNDICHAPSMPTYATVRNFEAFDTIDACIESGGRVPKNASR